MATVDVLLTAEEYALLPDYGRPTELVRGQIVPMNLPFPRHGQICTRVIYLLHRFLDETPLGQVLANDSGIITGRNPDTVRGADVAYYSFARVPRGPIPRGYLPVVPELVFEVRSATDRWSDIQAKVGEYLRAGVGVVCVLDEQTTTAHLSYADQAPRIVAADQELTFPGLLDGFGVVVGRFFE
jgi:Uma2 family endonuclease